MADSFMETTIIDKTIIKDQDETADNSSFISKKSEAVTGIALAEANLQMVVININDSLVAQSQQDDAVEEVSPQKEESYIKLDDEYTD